MTKADLEAQLTVIEALAPKLRKAGVLSVAIGAGGDVTFELAPAELPDPPMDVDDDGDDNDKPVFDDPKTFGRTGVGAKVPGRSKRDQEHNS